MARQAVQFWTQHSTPYHQAIPATRRPPPGAGRGSRPGARLYGMHSIPLIRFHSSNPTHPTHPPPLFPPHSSTQPDPDYRHPPPSPQGPIYPAHIRALSPRLFTHLTTTPPPCMQRRINIYYAYATCQPHIQRPRLLQDCFVDLWKQKTGSAICRVDARSTAGTLFGRSEVLSSLVE